MDLATLLIALLTLALGIAVGYFAASRYYAGLAQARSEVGTLAPAEQEQLYERLTALAAQASAAQARAERLEEENLTLSRQQSEYGQLLAALTPLNSQVTAMNTTIGKMREQSAAYSASLAEQLANQTHTQEELLRLSTRLTHTLAGERTRGNWGEYELRRIVEHAGMLEHVHFDTQISTEKLSAFGSSARPDMVIYLPGGGAIPVDAKVPLAALISSEGTNLAEHAKALKEHILTTAKRGYDQHFPGSPQFTVLFLPAESLLARALEADPDLMNLAMSHHVLLATPTTFLALLTSAGAAWQSTQVSEQASEVLASAERLRDSLRVFAGHLAKLGTSLTSSVGAYNRAVASLERTVLSALRGVEKVECPREIDADKGDVRMPTAAQLQPEDA